MILSNRVNTYGQDLLKRYGMRVHKIALDAGFTCPNRDGTKGTGGCTFCNNVSFSPAAGSRLNVPGQITKARAAIAKRTRARHFIAYFQAYTNTYADIAELEALYREALAQPDVIGIAVGTRPDCVSSAVLDLLVNRGHTLAEYRDTALAARARGIPLCTHLIIGLPGEDEYHYHATLDTVLDIGVDGLKLHPLHVVKHTMLAYQWRRGGYQPLTQADYIRIAADLIERTPQHIVFHRVTATASKDILLAPVWCSQKWNVLNGIEQELRQRGTRQGSRASETHIIEELQHVA